MATTVYEVEEIVLQDGSTVTLKPSNIRVMRKGNEMIAKLGEAETDDEGITRLLDVVCVCLKAQRPDFEHQVTDDEGVTKVVPNYELLEELFDMDLVFKVIEVCLKIKLNDPKLMEAAAQMALLQAQQEE